MMEGLNGVAELVGGELIKTFLRFPTDPPKQLISVKTV